MKRRAGLCGSLTVALLLAAGIAAVWGVVVKWAHGIVRAYEPPTVEEALLIRADGTPVVERFRYVDGRSVVPPRERFRDLAGNWVEVPDDDRWAPGAVLLRNRTPTGLLAGLLVAEESWDYRILQLSNDAISWYFVCDGQRHGSAYFVAYDTQEGQRVGYLGTAGYRAGALPTEEHIPFDGSFRGAYARILNRRSLGRFQSLESLARQGLPRGPDQIYVQADNDTVYQVNLQARTVSSAFARQPVRSAALLTPPGPGKRTSLLVMTDDAVLEIDDSNKVTRRFPLPEELRDRGFTWIETDRGEVVIQTNVDHDPRSSQGLWRIAWFDANGQRLRQEETWIQWPRWGDERVFTGAMLMPLVADWVVLVSGPLSSVFGWRQLDYWQAVGRVVGEQWPVLILVHAVAAGLAFLCYRRQIRFRAGRAERIAWPLFVFIFGWPGWLAYRFGRSWPVLERCPACASAVPRDRIPCAACGTEFPPPALTGSEVLA